MEDIKKFPVPSELSDLKDYANAAEKCRDKAVKGYFKFQLKNAIYFGQIAEQKNNKFWKSVREMYPELANVRIISYSPELRCVWDGSE